MEATALKRPREHYIHKANYVDALIHNFKDAELIDIVVKEVGFYESDFTKMIKSICEIKTRDLSYKQRRSLALFIASDPKILT